MLKATWLDVNQYETAKTADTVAPVTTINKPVWVKFNPKLEPTHDRPKWQNS